jgi:ParB family chromosome partitioning protein
VPVVVREATDEESLELALIENLQREDINPMEEAVAYQRLLQEFGLTQEQVAQRVGKSRAAVANSLRLLKLPAPIQESLRRGEIEEGHAKVLAGLPEARKQMRVWRRIVRSGISVKALAAIVARVAGQDVPRGTILGRPKKLRGALDPNLEDLEVRLMGKLSTKVVIRPRRDGQGGVIEVHYGDDEHLNQIFWDIVR